jgi:hypothetical protein
MRKLIIAALLLFAAALPAQALNTKDILSLVVTPEELGQLGAELKKKPAEAKRILSEHGLDEASFEKAIRKVSSSVEESRRYAAAYKKAS